MQRFTDKDAPAPAQLDENAELMQYIDSLKGAVDTCIERILATIDRHLEGNQ